MSAHEWCSIGLALFAGYSWGYGYGMKHSNKEYKTAIDLACKDYREANKRIESLRNRLMAARWLKRKKALKSRTKP